MNSSHIEISKQYQLLSVDISNETNRLEDECESYKLQLQAHQKQYVRWSEEKASIVDKWCKTKMRLYTIRQIPLDSIARDMVHEMKQIGVSEGGISYIYKIIPQECRRSYSLGSAYRDSNIENSTLENLTVEQEIDQELEVIEEKLKKLPASRRAKTVTKVKDKIKRYDFKREKEEDYGVHQAEPPESMQGPSAFSNAVGLTASWFEQAAERYRKIENEIKIYRPSNDQERADDWNASINVRIIGNILDPIFMDETDAEADRKWSTSRYHWVKIIKERIAQSKHGAGKKSENYISDPLTGAPVYTPNKRPMKRGNTRERVGDAERPIVNTAIKFIEANSGLMTLHDWLENDQGGHRRYRKAFLHDYFSEAALAGSLKSGNENYGEYMREYKKKQREKFGLTA